MAANLRIVTGVAGPLATHNTQRVVNIRMLSPTQQRADVQSHDGQGLSRLTLSIVILLAHALVFTVLKSSAAKPEMTMLERPMIVSLIAPPLIVPVIESESKQEPEPIQAIPRPKIVSVVKNISPKVVGNTSIGLPIPEQSVEAKPEVPLNFPPVAVVAEVEKPKQLPVAEDKFELPRFGVSYLHNPDPVYPKLSRRMHEQGRVLLKVLVSANGDAETVDLEKSSHYELLDQAAIDAVKKWRFIPAKRNNQDFSAYVLVPISFSLDI